MFVVRNCLIEYVMKVSFSLLRDEVVALDEDVLRPLDFVINNDTSIIIPDYSGENRLCWLNIDEKLVRKIGIIPLINNENII